MMIFNDLPSSLRRTLLFVSLAWRFSSVLWAQMAHQDATNLQQLPTKPQVQISGALAVTHSGIWGAGAPRPVGSYANELVADRSHGIGQENELYQPGISLDHALQLLQQCRDSLDLLLVKEQVALVSAKQERIYKQLLGCCVLPLVAFNFLLLYHFQHERFLVTQLQTRNQQLHRTNRQLLANAAATNVCENQFVGVKGHFLELTGKNKLALRLSDIRYLEARAKGIDVHTKQGEVYRDWRPLKEITALLPPDSFLRIHRSFVVNLRHVQKHTIKNVEIEGTISLPISRSYRTVVTNAMAREKLVKVA